MKHAQKVFQAFTGRGMDTMNQWVSKLLFTDTSDGAEANSVSAGIPTI